MKKIGKIILFEDGVTKYCYVTEKNRKWEYHRISRSLFSSLDLPIVEFSKQYNYSKKSKFGIDELVMVVVSILLILFAIGWNYLFWNIVG